MFFGERKIVLNINNYKRNLQGYYQIDEQVLNFEEYYSNNRHVFETEGDRLLLSIPFKRDSKIRCVKRNIKDIDFVTIKEFILNARYINLNEDDYYKFIYFGHFRLSLGFEDRLKSNIKIKKSGKKIVFVDQINNYSVFESIIE